MNKPTPAEVFKAREVLRADRKARKADRQTFSSRPFPAKVKPRHGRERDAAYLSWLHDLPCLACMIMGSAPREHAHIEAAHQKAQDADRGWHKKAGVRPSDDRTCPLCAWHHRIGPTCCDPAQAKFWALVGVDVIDFCRALYAAFKAGEDGAAVVRQFALRRAA